MRLFKRLSLYRHPGGVRLEIPHRITPIPGHAETLAAKLAAVRHTLKTQRRIT